MTPERQRGRRQVIWTEVQDNGIWCTLDCGHHTLVRRQNFVKALSRGVFLRPQRIPERLNCPLCDSPAMRIAQAAAGDAPTNDVG